MSVLMKKPHTNVVIDGQMFHVLKQHKNTLVTIVEKLSVEDPFRELEEKLPAYAISLRGARGKEGISQKELSKKTGIAVTNISKMENGQRRIGEKVAKKLAKTLRIGYKVFIAP
jgi:ribosome-binding protein aMBF1 (putative translation factor)